MAMSRLLEEDPSLQMHRETSTNEVILSGLGDSHLDVATQRLQRKFGVNVTLDVPKVAYRETITAKAAAEGRHVRQTGGHGQYGVVNLEVEPLPRGEGFEFVDKVVGGVVPAPVHPGGRKGRPRDAGAGRDRRVPGGRRPLRAGVRQVPPRRLE